MKRHARLRSTKPMRTRTPLRRKGWMKRKAPRRLERRAHHDELREFVRTRPCASCGRPAVPRPAGHKGPWRTGIEAAHITLSRNEKGTSLKVTDEQLAPLCGSDPRDGHDGCHQQWDEHRGRFAGWSDRDRYITGGSWVAATLARFEANRLEAIAADMKAKAA